MEKYNICIVTDKSSWINAYIPDMVNRLRQDGHSVLHMHEFDKDHGYDFVFLLSYFKIVKKDELQLNKHNLVVHESDLPKGKGWSPLTWQVLEGEKIIPIVLFEASEKVDDGIIYIREMMHFSGLEMLDEIRKVQVSYTMKMCYDFIKNNKKIITKAHKQKGMATFYSRRYPKDSEINPNKTIAEQFNLLRVVDNEHYPAYFYHHGQKYIIKIYKE